jgi:hypothetical protein
MDSDLDAIARGVELTSLGIITLSVEVHSYGSRRGND